MRMATWNVNSLKARLDKVTWWLARAGPDVLLMQETKLADKDAPVDVFRAAGYDPKAAPIYAHALVGMVAFVGQWWTESPKPPPVETVASHIAGLAWMGLRHLPKRPALLETTGKRK